MAKVSPEPTIEIMDLDEIPSKTKPASKPPLRLPPLQKAKVAPIGPTGVPVQTVHHNAVISPISPRGADFAPVHPVVPVAATVGADCEAVKQPLRWFQKPVWLVIPFLACTVVIILLALAVYAVNWEQPVLVATENPTIQSTLLQASPTTMSVTTPEGTTTASSETTTGELTTSTGITTSTTTTSAPSTANTSVPSTTTTTPSTTNTSVPSTTNTAVPTTAITSVPSTTTTAPTSSSSTTITSAPSTTTTAPTSSSSTTITSAPSTTTTSTPSTTTTSVPSTTTTSAPSSRTTTLAETTTITDPTTTTMAATTTAAPFTTTNSISSTMTSTTTTNEITTTVRQPIKAAYSFQLKIADNFTSYLLDYSSLPYHLLSISTCDNVSSLFNTSSAYGGCVVTAIQAGSIIIDLTVLFTHPPDADLTLTQQEVVSNLTAGLPLLVSGLSEESINLTNTETCTVCDVITSLEATIQMQAMDKCNLANPCANNATCVSGLDRYFCICSDSFYGVDCEIRTADCDSILCNSNGECVADMAGELLCECSATYEGDQCEMEIKNITYPCSNFTTPCSGHGDCIDLSETEYRCICDAGYNGTDCDEDMDDCANDPCYHGNCTDLINGYSCDCDAGYEGRQCQINIYDCTNTSCGLNGTCYDVVDGYLCGCDAGYTGSDCHSICDDSPCYNNGNCTLCAGGYCEDTKLSFSCDCPVDIYGILCTNERYPTG